MTWLRVWASRFAALFRKSRLEQEMDEEIRQHLEMLAEENLRKGMSPEEAGYAARRSFGGVEQAKETWRDQCGLPLLETTLQDIRYGLRMLRKTPGFTAVAVLTLGLGIGANTAIFSLVNGLILSPLPYKHADRLVLVAAADAQNGLVRNVTSYPDFADWRDQNSAFTRLAAYRAQSYDLAGGGRPERVRGLRITEDLLPLLEEKPALGRTFLPEEYQSGRNRVVLISDSLWRRHLNADPDILGRTLKLNDEVYSIIGIMPPRFEFPPEEHSMLYTPLTPDPDRNHGWLWAVGRLKTGEGLRQAQAEMDAIAFRLEQLYPKSNKGRGVNLIPLHEAVVGRMRPAVLVFMGAVALVMLIVCANVANLMLSRTMARDRELAVRAAIGASRMRLVRQLLTESVLLSLAGGALGLLLAAGGVNLLIALLQKNLPIPRLENISIDGGVLAFTFLVSLVTGAIFGFAPALIGSRVELNESLKAGSRTLAGSLRPKRLRSLLVVSEMALALVLLIGAGLMMKSFLILSRVDSGLDTRHLLALDFSLHELRYSQADIRMSFFQQVLERVGAIPGVTSAAWVTDLPLTDNTDSLGFNIQGRPGPAPGRQYSARFNVVGPDYFRTLGIPFLRGRDFSERDSRDAPGVAIINDAAARRFWPKEDALGKQISTDGTRWFSLIAVTGNVRQLGPQSESAPEIYLSYLQDPEFWPYRTLIARSSADPLKLVSLVEQAVWSINKDQPVSNVRTMEEVLGKSVAQPWVFTVLLGIFALIALGLAAIGIYGMLAYSVTQRTQEIGVRIALGAKRGDVLRLVLGEGMLLTIIGLGIGLLGGFGLTRVLSNFLYSVRPTDPVTFVAVAFALTAIAALACYIPARRAMKVDPIVALRIE